MDAGVSVASSGHTAPVAPRFVVVALLVAGGLLAVAGGTLGPEPVLAGAGRALWLAAVVAIALAAGTAGWALAGPPPWRRGLAAAGAAGAVLGVLLVAAPPPGAGSAMLTGALAALVGGGVWVLVRPSGGGRRVGDRRLV